MKALNSRPICRFHYPIKEDFNSFVRYNYISRTSLGEFTSEIFVEETLKMIEENPGAEE